MSASPAAAAGSSAAATATTSITNSKARAATPADPSSINKPPGTSSSLLSATDDSTAAALLALPVSFTHNHSTTATSGAPQQLTPPAAPLSQLLSGSLMNTMAMPMRHHQFSNMSFLNGNTASLQQDASAPPPAGYYPYPHHNYNAVNQPPMQHDPSNPHSNTAGGVPTVPAFYHYGQYPPPNGAYMPHYAPPPQQQQPVAPGAAATKPSSTSNTNSSSRNSNDPPESAAKSTAKHSKRSSNGGNNSDSEKDGKACLPCYLAKTLCTKSRPCERCTRLSRESECVDRPKHLKRPRSKKPTVQYDEQGNPLPIIPAKRGRKPKAWHQMMAAKAAAEAAAAAAAAQGMQLPADYPAMPGNAVQGMSLQTTLHPNSSFATTTANAVNNDSYNHHHNSDSDSTDEESSDEEHGDSPASKQRRIPILPPAHSHEAGAVNGHAARTPPSDASMSDNDSNFELDNLDAEDRQLSRAFLAMAYKSFPQVELALSKGRISLANYELLTAHMCSHLHGSDLKEFRTNCLTTATMEKVLERMGSDNWLARTKFHFSYTSSPNDALPDDPKMPNFASLALDIANVQKVDLRKHKQPVKDEQSNNHDAKPTSSTAVNVKSSPTYDEHSTQNEEKQEAFHATSDAAPAESTSAADDASTTHRDTPKPSSNTYIPMPATLNRSITEEIGAEEGSFDYELYIDACVTVNREFERVFGFSQSEVKAMFNKSGVTTLYRFLIPIHEQIARLDVQSLFAVNPTKSRVDERTFRQELERITNVHQKACLSAESQFMINVIINTKWNRRLPAMMVGRFVPAKQLSGFSYVWLPLPKAMIDECGESGGADV